MPISAEQIRQAYLAAKRAYDGELSSGEATSHLVTHHGVNSSTANTFVRVLRKMLDGQIFTRGLAISPTRHFLDGILSEPAYGRPALTNALNALMGHIEYYEGRRNVEMRGLREVHQEYSSRL